MKANELNCPGTVADLRKRLAQLTEQIAAKEISHEELRDSIPRLIAEHIGSDLAAMRERKKLAELADELRHLRSAQAVIEQALRDAEQREADAAHNLKVSKGERHADELRAEAAEAEALVDRLGPVLMRMRELDTAFCNALPAYPSGFEQHSYSLSLARRIALRIYAKTGGAIRPERVFQSAYEIDKSGQTDLVQHAVDYCTVGLRGNRAAPLIRPEPDDAA